MVKPGHDTGQVIIIVALALPVLLGIMALAIDIEYLRNIQQRMQAAADAAALAGAAELAYGTAATAARTDAAKNGFTHNVNGVTVTVNNPPVESVTFNGLLQYTEVIITQSRPTYFMKIFGWGSVPVKARAVGFLGNGPNCMYALSGSDSGAIKLTPAGGYAVKANCGLIIDSSSSSALKTDGNTLTADSIGIVGGCNDCGSNVTPPPDTGILPVLDPLAYVPEPTPSGTVRADPKISAPGSYTIQPGIYSSGITLSYVSGKAGPDVTFAPGEYYITGGTFNVDSPGTNNDGTDGLAYRHVNIHGSGVFIYLGANANVAYQGGNGHFANSYGGLIAQTTGTYAGILFFQSRATASYTAALSSGLGDGYTGTLYFPSVSLKYMNSKPNAAQYMITVAQTIELYRDMTTLQTINYDTSGLANGSPIKKAVLVE